MGEGSEQVVVPGESHRFELWDGSVCVVEPVKGAEWQSALVSREVDGEVCWGQAFSYGVDDPCHPGSAQSVVDKMRVSPAPFVSLCGPDGRERSPRERARLASGSFKYAADPSRTVTHDGLTVTIPPMCCIDCGAVAVIEEPGGERFGGGVVGRCADHATVATLSDTSCDTNGADF